MKKATFLIISCVMFSIGALICGIWVCNKRKSPEDISKWAYLGDRVEGTLSEAIVYNGVLYCGIPMLQVIPEQPEDFAEIGIFQGPLTDEKEELTSTMIFHDGEVLYHYIDMEGNHSFCVKHKRADTYLGIFQAQPYEDGFFIIGSPRLINY